MTPRDALAAGSQALGALLVLMALVVLLGVPGALLWVGGVLYLLGQTLSP